MTRVSWESLWHSSCTRLGEKSFWCCNYTVWPLKPGAHPESLLSWTETLCLLGCVLFVFFYILEPLLITFTCSGQWRNTVFLWIITWLFISMKVSRECLNLHFWLNCSFLITNSVRVELLSPGRRCRFWKTQLRVTADHSGLIPFTSSRAEFSKHMICCRDAVKTLRACSHLWL